MLSSNLPNNNYNIGFKDKSFYVFNHIRIALLALLTSFGRITKLSLFYNITYIQPCLLVSLIFNPALIPNTRFLMFTIFYEMYNFPENYIKENTHTSKSCSKSFTYHST